MKNKTDLTNGSILNSLITFSIPILISSVFQQLYNAADTAIVGNFLGEQSLAAIGSTSAIFELIVGFALGVGNGMSVVTARYHGAKNYEMVKKSFAHALIIGLFITLTIMMIGHLGLHHLLKSLNTPLDIIDEAYSYIYIILLFVQITFLYNLGSGLLRAVGNSFIPLVILVFACFINVALDIIFITRFNLGIQGAAIATVIAQTFSVAACFIYIYLKVPELLLSKVHFYLDKQLLIDLLTQGLSMGLMSSVVSIGSIVLQTALNKFGAIIIAAQVTARKVQFFFILPISSLATSLTTFVSQNYGAKQYHRIKKAINYSMFLSVFWGISSAILLRFISVPLIKAISGSNNVLLINTAKNYIAFATLFFAVLGMLLCLRNSLQGLGQKIEPLISSIIELIGKIIFVLLIVPKTGYWGIILCEPIIWVIMCFQLAYSFYKNPFIKEIK